MKIIEQTSSKLVVQHRPSRDDYVETCVVIILVLLFCMGIDIRRSMGVTQIDCDRTDPREARCVVRQSRFLGFIPQPAKTETHARVTGAVVRTGDGWNEDESPLFEHWVAFQTPRGEVPAVGGFQLVNPMTRTRKMNEVEREIDRFLSSELPSLSLWLLPNWEWRRLFDVGVGVVLSAGPSAALYLDYQLRTDSVVFDRESPNIHFNRQMFLGQVAWDLTFERVRKVSVITYGQKHHQLALILVNGKQYQVLPKTQDLQSVEVVRQAIAKILLLS